MRIVSQAAYSERFFAILGLYNCLPSLCMLKSVNLHYFIDRYAIMKGLFLSELNCTKKRGAGYEQDR